MEARLLALEEENILLRAQMQRFEEVRAANGATGSSHGEPKRPSANMPSLGFESSSSLTKDQIERYSRQLLLSNGFIGVMGQEVLLQSSVLVVGAGGIGSTVLLYLAACGIGKLGIVDHDSVDMSNLHRQIIHTQPHSLGTNKAQSAYQTIHNLNPTVQCDVIQEPLTHANAMQIVNQYDCVVDASDNPYTRYLLNDTCLWTKRPLVSGSAIGTQGQLTVYNFSKPGKACYRCMYPSPERVSNQCSSCSDAGVLGPVPGFIGIMQTIETIKLLARKSKRPMDSSSVLLLEDHLLMYDALQCSFFKMKKIARQSHCQLCGEEPTIRTMDDSAQNLQLVRGPTMVIATNNNENKQREGQRSVVDGDTSGEWNISCHEYHRIREQGTLHLLLDVRVPQQYELCSLAGSHHIPLAELSNKFAWIEQESNGWTVPVYCICRRGVASLQAVEILRKEIMKRDSGQRSKPVIASIVGGLTAWHEQIDSNFPRY